VLVGLVVDLMMSDVSWAWDLGGREEVAGNPQDISSRRITMTHHDLWQTYDL
jgi:hypothetical protein